MKDYRVSDVRLDERSKTFIQEKLNALRAEGWTLEGTCQSADTLYLICSRASQ